jgi:hypothetical protein
MEAGVRVARFFLVQHTKAGKNIPDNHKTITNERRIDQMSFTQIGIFGLKICHLATLVVIVL